MKGLMMPLKGLRKKISADSVGFFRVVTFTLLSLSLLVVLMGWFEFKDKVDLAMPLEQKLAVPLMAFGVIAIISILLFVKPGLPMFLAIAIIAYVVGGGELIEQLNVLFSGDTSQVLEWSGSIDSPVFDSGGVLPSESQ